MGSNPKGGAGPLLMLFLFAVCAAMGYLLSLGSA